MIGKDDFNSIASLEELRAVRKDNCREIKALYGRLAADVEDVEDCFNPQNLVDGLLMPFAPLLKLYRLFFR